MSSNNPFVFTGSMAYPFGEDLVFHNHPFAREEDLVDVSMPYIDPTLQSHSPSDPYLGHWDLPQQQLVVQRYLEDNQKTAFFNADVPSKMTPNRALMRPTVGIPPVPPSSHVRFASPISSTEPSSSSDSMRSPPADAESYYDSFSSPPPDTAALHSPFHQHPPFEQHWSPRAYAVQFTGMGPRDAYVNPSDISPNQQPLDRCESESGNASFTLPQRGYSYESYATSQCDMEPTQHNAVTIDLPVRRLASPEEMRPAVKEEIKAVRSSSQYPPPPGPDRAADESDGKPIRLPASKRRKSEDDGDYKPNKKPTLNTRGQKGRAPKPRQAAVTSSSSRAAATESTTSTSKKTKSAAPSAANSNNLIPPSQPKALPPSTSSSKGTYACHDCSHTFKDQTNLESHVKKQHTRPFTCVFHFAGCGSTFASKNEWKRHVASQHLLLHYWLCQEGPCASVNARCSTNGPSPLHTTATRSRAGSGRSRNAPTSASSSSACESGEGDHPPPPNGTVFNRKDLYTQHVRRMHMPPQIKKSLKQQQQQTTQSSNKKNAAATAAGNDVPAEWEERLRGFQQRAMQERCKLPEMMRCPAATCDAVFHGPDSWDQRMEHVARHLEKAAAGKEEAVVFGGKHDPSLVQWAADVDIIRKSGRGGDGWELNTLLKRGGHGGAGGGNSNGIVMMVTSTVDTVAAAAASSNKSKAAIRVKEEEVKSEIVVSEEEDDDDDDDGDEIVVGAEEEDDEDDLRDAEGEELEDDEDC
ncbi:hypothetical protein B0H66DRAFT_124784 [Apodospora peruviana]|uniref:C2H2-type domain-containing protein n=1 Tax=Apodospora peruviana TaxID=516989 RepID=A0AAE0II99_9PEZI|nr:hypothetical protein B0H66DRAFT_124784 [Apodospora peruviana]